MGAYYENIGIPVPERVEKPADPLVERLKNMPSVPYLGGYSKYLDYNTILLGGRFLHTNKPLEEQANPLTYTINTIWEMGNNYDIPAVHLKVATADLVAHKLVSQSASAKIDRVIHGEEFAEQEATSYLTVNHINDNTVLFDENYYTIAQEFAISRLPLGSTGPIDPSQLTEVERASQGEYITETLGLQVIGDRLHFGLRRVRTETHYHLPEWTPEGVRTIISVKEGERVPRIRKPSPSEINTTLGILAIGLKVSPAVLNNVISRSFGA
jgi:hypothetical protein